MDARTTKVGMTSMINNDTQPVQNTELKDKIEVSYDKKTLIPNYTLETLVNRLTMICIKRYSDISREGRRKCREAAVKTSKGHWEDYYGRF